jgi:hypothetical protein
MAANDWRRWYAASVTTTAAGARHLRVWKLGGGSGIGWDVLQQIKNELLGPEVTCVELYPAQPNVVDELNLRHLWEVDDAALGVGFHHRGRRSPAY